MQTCRRLLALAIVLALCLVSGCHEHVTEGSQSIYRFAGWVGPTIIAVGLLAIPAGWFLRRWSQVWGVVLLVMGPFLVFLVGPSLFTDRVVIDDDHFEATYGFWFDPSVHHLRFQDLREIQYISVRGSRGQRNYQMQCRDRAGNVTVVHAGDLVRPTIPEILLRARKAGVKVGGEAP